MEESASILGWETAAVSVAVFIGILLLVRFAMGGSFGNVHDDFGGPTAPPLGQASAGISSFSPRQATSEDRKGDSRHSSKPHDPEEKKWDDELSSLLGPDVRSGSEGKTEIKSADSNLESFFGPRSKRKIESEPQPDIGSEADLPIESNSNAVADLEPEIENELDLRSRLKADIKAELQAELKAELESELKAELKAEIKATLETEFKLGSEAQTTSDADSTAEPELEAESASEVVPAKNWRYGLLEAAYTVDLDRSEDWEPNRKKFEPISEEGLLEPPEELICDESSVEPSLAPASKTEGSPIAAEERRPQEATVPLKPRVAEVNSILPSPTESEAPAMPPKAPATPVARVNPIKPIAPIPSEASPPEAIQPSSPSVPALRPSPVHPTNPVVRTAEPLATGASPASFSPPAPILQPDESVPKSKWAQLFGKKDPSERIGKRVPIKKGKLKGRYGTIMSVDGDAVTIADKVGKTTVVSASDL